LRADGNVPARALVIQIEMPYCSQCGTQLQDRDQFCARCGARQPGVPPLRPSTDFAGSFTPRTASVLCYIPWVGWIAAIVVLASSHFRHNRTVRFHAFQGLYLFVAWLIVQWVIAPLTWFTPGPHLPVSALLHLLILVVWIYMLVKTSQDEMHSLPIIGELAERSLTE
jgi:uncharacterized membrane protein